ETTLPPPLADDRVGRLEIALWLVPVLAFFAFPSYLVLGSQVLIAGLFALSLDLILGYAGIVSLGHAAFFGVGAYVDGIASVHGLSDPVMGLVVSAAVAGALGFATSFLIVGGQALTRLMVTLAVGLSLHEVANQASSITGGSDGLSGMHTGALFGVFQFDLLGRVAYLYSLVLCFAGFLLVRRLIYSPFGLSLRGLRDNARRMDAIGAPLRQRLNVAYTLSAALAGVAGAASAQTTEFVGLEVLSLERSASVLVMLVLGGAGRLYGGLIGSCLFMLLSSVLSDLDPAYWQFWMGFTVVLVALFARGGLLGHASAATTRLRRPKRAAVATQLRSMQPDARGRP
ncbi:MAG TPA: branched-chain amino acid ABC transporter permease, partial [Polyangiaceae bacterium]|nr:branched-chain amino acid ABC transporter permease [Polyangiaceae bacterium]